MTRWLRRVFHRPPTMADLAAAVASNRDTRARIEALDLPGILNQSFPKIGDADPYAGVVNGPLLVDRTRHNHQVHIDRYADDTGWPVTEWGTFTAQGFHGDAA